MCRKGKLWRSAAMIRAATAGEVHAYLLGVIDDFPFLRDHVDLHEYTEKLGSEGAAFAAVPEGAPASPRSYGGIVAGYFNNFQEGSSYVSILHVRREFRKSRLGRLLVDKAIEHSKEKGLHAMRLHVNKTNTAALGFYRHLGFEIVAETDRKFELRRELPGGGPPPDRVACTERK
jgi:ribosomal protein S18 acetylase RimI-like enzyme